MSLSLDEARQGLSSDEEEIRRGAVARLAAPSTSEEAADVLDFLVEAMGDPSWRVRKEAAARAAAFGDAKLAAEVLALTGSPSRVVHRSLPVDDPKQRRPEIRRWHIISSRRNANHHTLR